LNPDQFAAFFAAIGEKRLNPDDATKEGVIKPADAAANAPALMVSTLFNDSTRHFISWLEFWVY